MKKGECLKLFRKERGLTQQQLAKELGVSLPLIVAIEGGSRPITLKLNEKFKSVYNYDFYNENVINPNLVAIPYHHIGAAAGTGTWLDDEPPEDTMVFDKRFLKQILRTDSYSRLHIIYAIGDSMDSGWNQPDDIKDGDLLMVDASQTTGNNQIFVLRYNKTDLRVKRLFKRGDTLYISSNNPKYEEEKYRIDDSDIEIEIIGRVVWNGSKENI